MSAAERNVPDLLLGTTSLELPARTTRDRALEVAGRFREPESLAVTLVKALDAGAQAVVAVPSPRLRAALRELRRAVPLMARLPLTPPADDLHYAHALLAPAADGERGSGAGLSLASLALAPAALAGDLAAHVATRCEREAPGMGARAWAGMLLAAPVTDLALAAGHAKFFERMVRYGRARFGGVAGFETANLGFLLARLGEWGIAPDFVKGPVNARGYGMKPDPDTVLDAIENASIPVIASDVRAGGTIPLDEGAEWVRDHGVAGLEVDLVEMDDVAAELRALART